MGRVPSGCRGYGRVTRHVLTYRFNLPVGGGSSDQANLEIPLTTLVNVGGG